MVTTTRHLIDFADLHYVAIECGTCLTQVRLDLARNDIGIVDECPSCHAAFGGIVQALHNYRAVYKAIVAATKHRVVVDVEAHDAALS